MSELRQGRIVLARLLAAIKIPPPEGLDVDMAGDQELREAYQRHTAARTAWYASRDLRPVAELLADPVAMADEPWDPAADPS